MSFGAAVGSLPNSITRLRRLQTLYVFSFGVILCAVQRGVAHLAHVTDFPGVVYRTCSPRCILPETLAICTHTSCPTLAHRRKAHSLQACGRCRETLYTGTILFSLYSAIQYYSVLYSTIQYYSVSLHLHTVNDRRFSSVPCQPYMPVFPTA